MKRRFAGIHCTVFPAVSSESGRPPCLVKGRRMAESAADIRFAACTGHHRRRAWQPCLAQNSRDGCHRGVGLRLHRDFRGFGGVRRVGGGGFQHGLGIGHGIDHVTIDFAGQDDVDAIGDVKRCGQSDVGGRSGGSGLGGGQRASSPTRMTGDCALCTAFAAAASPVYLLDDIDNRCLNLTTKRRFSRNMIHPSLLASGGFILRKKRKTSPPVISKCSASGKIFGGLCF